MFPLYTIRLGKFFSKVSQKLFFDVGCHDTNHELSRTVGFGVVFVFSSPLAHVSRNPLTYLGMGTAEFINRQF